VIAGAAFVVIVSGVAHLLFSWIGFDVADQGFDLAMGRRLLDGQVPHRDFISIRPVLSPLLHAPQVLFGGDYFFWASRLVFLLEVSAIVWMWAVIVDRLSPARSSTAHRFAVASIAWSLSAFSVFHHFYTVDGLLLVSAGLASCLTGHFRGHRLAGYLLVGAAGLCKQNYFLMAPLSLLLLGDAHKVRYWLAALTPAAVYATAMALLGALPDAFEQVRPSGGPGFLAFILSAWSYPRIAAGLVYGAGAMALLARAAKGGAGSPAGSLAGGSLLVASVAAAGFSMATGRYVSWGGFFLLGVALGATLCRAAVARERADVLRTGLLALLTVGTAMISVGAPNPVLGGGLLAALVLAHVHSFLPFAPFGSQKRRVYPVFLLTGLMLADHAAARYFYVYRDRPASELTRHAGGVFAGARGIRTSKRTYRFLEDLNRAIDRTGGRRYAIVPDLALYWALAPQANPLAIDWPQNVELNTPSLRRRVFEGLREQRGDLVVILQKAAQVEGSENEYAWGSFYSIVPYVRRHFTKTGETTFFELYE